MEIRKSYKADLEHRRLSGFLLGLIAVLAVFLVALEYSSTGGDNDMSDEFLEDLSQDLEALPIIIRKDVKAAAQASKRNSIPEKVRAAEKTSADMAADKTESDEEESTDENNTLASGTDLATDNETQETTDEETPDDKTDSDNPLNFRVVEKLPEFPGGIEGFMKWLTATLRYPPQAQKQRIQGTVLVSFIINADGSATDHKIVKPAHPELDREAMRVIKMMPEWKPGEDHGKACRTYFRIPIVFKL